MDQERKNRLIDLAFERANVPAANREIIRPLLEQALDRQEANTEIASELDHLYKRIEEFEAREQKRELDTPAVTGKNPFLTLEQKAAPFFGDEYGESTDYDAKNVRFGALLAAIANKDLVVKHLNDDEQKAFNSLTLGAGDVTVPTAISALFIDAVRPSTRVLRAGARTYPMEAQRVVLPGWNTPPSASWRAEGGAFTDGGGTLREVALHAKMVQCYFDIGIEVLEDSASNLDGASNIIVTEAGRAIGQAIDKAALIGDPKNGEPLGIYNTPGVTIDSTLGANGAVPADYDFLINAVGTVWDASFDASAVLFSSRTARELAKLRTGLSGDKTQLRVPDPIAGLQRYPSNQIPNTLTKGAGSNASLAFTAQWDQLVIGFRPSAGVNVLRDPYTQMAANGYVRFYFWQRADIALLNLGAFCVSDGIL